MTTTNQLDLTSKIQRFQIEALLHGDMDMVRICEQALEGDTHAREACEIILAGVREEVVRD